MHGKKVKTGRRTEAKTNNRKERKSIRVASRGEDEGIE